MDEPTSALEHRPGEQIVKLLADLNRTRQLATIMVTHDLAQLAVADQAHEMTDGRLSEQVPA